MKKKKNLWNLIYLIIRWFFSINHKDIATLYILFGFFSTLLGTKVFFKIKQELIIHSGSQSINGIFLLDNLVDVGYAFIMIFLAVIPILIGGFGNWFIPLILGISDMAFPRMNIISFLLLPPSLFLLLTSGLLATDLYTGWPFFLSLSSKSYLNLAILGFHLAEISSILSIFNLLITVFNMRPPELSMFQLPLIIWILFLIAIILLLSLPVIGSSIFGHIEIYIWILPTFGIINQFITGSSRKTIFGYLGRVFVIVFIGILAFIIWGHVLTFFL